jgi:hypothetical protein
MTMRLFGDFEENGYRFRAFIPEAASEGIAFKVEISHADKPLHDFRVPMLHEPRFGPDAGDVRTLEAVTDAILKFLPDPSRFGHAVARRIDTTVAELS